MQTLSIRGSARAAALLFVGAGLASCGGNDGDSSGNTGTGAGGGGTSGGGTVAPAPVDLAIANPGSLLPPLGANIAIAETDCTLARLGAPVAAGQIGLPTTGASIASATWVAAAGALPAYCRVDGAIAPVDGNAPSINFRVALPASWNHRSAHLGGSGMNGSIPNVAGTPNSGILQPPLGFGFATFASDSGHAGGALDWGLNDEAAQNLGFMQMKKTYDVAMVVLQRMYGQLPRFRYYLGSSQGGREGLTVGQRFANDYDGIVSTVPIVNFTSLTMSPVWNQIQQIPAAKHVPTAKSAAIRTEIMRQCDKLDGLADGIISNYQGCRAIFDITRGASGRNPWAAKQCPGNIDPNPADNTDAACLTEGQIDTLNFFMKPYVFATPLANGVTSFGNYLPGPGIPGLLTNTRYVGQEGGGTTVYNGGPGRAYVLGALMQDLSANAITRYVEGGDLDARRRTISEWADATNPDLEPFYRRGGKWIMTIGTDDTTASPGAQLNYYQSVIDKMGGDKVDAFARFYVVPQGDHGARGNNAAVNGDGQTIPVEAFPSALDRLTMLTDWVEKNMPPGKSVVASTPTRSRPVCSYPTYPRYVGGDATSAASFTCATP